ncbi:MAG: hypothetical protein QXK65_03220 [Candidatus Micrarchaeaceae archaeon]
MNKAGAAQAYSNPMLLYHALRKRFGFLDWWPGDTKFEILVGAILTQQTSWKNVEKAIANLKSAHVLNLKSMAKIKRVKLERLIRQSGFYRQKAQRLHGVCSYILNNYGSLQRMFKQEAKSLRKELLELNGIGRETADSIILYAAEKPIFVIDAYTRRAMARLSGGALDENEDYDALRKYFESRIRKDVELYKDFHAQFVELGKNYCKTKPLCPGCPLNDICIYYKKEKSQKAEAG